MSRSLSPRRYQREFGARARTAQRRAPLHSTAELTDQVEIYLIQVGFSLNQYRSITDPELKLQHLLEAESSAEIMTSLLGVIRQRRYGENP